MVIKLFCILTVAKCVDLCALQNCIELNTHTHMFKHTGKKQNKIKQTAALFAFLNVM